MEAKERIIKLLQLTTSPNKHEAMNAMDAANKILTDNNLHWVDFSMTFKQPFPHTLFLHHDKQEIE